MRQIAETVVGIRLDEVERTIRLSNLILPEFDALFLVNCFIFKVILSGGFSLSRAFRYGKVE